jgi:outer membrane receptor protein involved in Fe transport
VFFTFEINIMMKTIKRLIATALIPCMAFAGVPLTAQAAMVSTEQAMVTVAGDADREHVSAFFARADVQTALQAQGVNANDAIERVKAMSDVEVAQLADRVDQAPAGAGVVGVLFTVFLILLVTDILGLTSVFPFTRSIR